MVVVDIALANFSSSIYPLSFDDDLLTRREFLRKRLRFFILLNPSLHNDIFPTTDF